MSISKEYFDQELDTFMKLLGDRTFMFNASKRNLMVTALGHLYLELSDEDAEVVRPKLEVAIDSLTRREDYMARNPCPRN